MTRPSAPSSRAARRRSHTVMHTTPSGRRFGISLVPVPIYNLGREIGREQACLSPADAPGEAMLRGAAADLIMLAVLFGIRTALFGRLGLPRVPRSPRSRFG